METVRIVCIGGGTGLPVLLRGLSNEPGVDLTAIVSVSDNGGSSGRLRNCFGIPAVGDLRNCLVALSGEDTTLASIFQHRFSGGEELEGHALGNLIVTALCEQTGNLQDAIDAASRLLGVRGRALAVTERPATLCARFVDGSVVRGECQIAQAGRQVDRVWLEPAPVPPSDGVIRAIQSADAVVLAPGSLYTSLIPNLLVDGVAEAVRTSPAIKILVCNLMMQRGETEGYSAADHLEVVERYAGRRAVDFFLVNDSMRHFDSRYLSSEETGVVACDAARVRQMGTVPVEADLLTQRGQTIRHDPKLLGRFVLELTRASLRQECETKAA